MNKIEINYAIPLGLKCPMAYWIKDNGLRKCSYPFDWTRLITLDPVIESLNDNFSKLLDKSYYTDTKTPRRFKYTCGHSSLTNGHDLFWHRDMRLTDHYAGLCRSVERFHGVLKKSSPKLFMIGTYFRENLDVPEHIKNVKRLNNELSKLTNNFYIFSLVHFKSKYFPSDSKTKVETNGNIKFAELYTEKDLGLKKNGKRLRLNSDWIIERELIHSLYKFSIFNDI